MRKHSIIERTHTSLASKNNVSTNRGTSEGPETLTQEYLTRRIRFCLVYFCLVVIWKVTLKRGQKLITHKMYQADLGYLCRYLSVRGLEFVEALFVYW